MRFDKILGDGYVLSMGRKPLNVKETKIRLTDEQRARIEALVGPNRMAEFIRGAVEAELDRQERKHRQKDKTE